MGYVDVAGLGHTLPDGRELFAEVSFRVGEGAKIALVGPNGAGKTTLLRMVAGDVPVQRGAIARAGGLGVMRQFIGTLGATSRTDDDLSGAAHPGQLDAFALSLAAPAVRDTGSSRRSTGVSVRRRLRMRTSTRLS